MSAVQSIGAQTDNTSTVVFIDGDHLTHALYSLRIGLDYSALLALFRDMFGSGVVVRFYASYQPSSPLHIAWLEKLSGIGFHVVTAPVQKIGSSDRYKSSVDTQLVVDALSLSPAFEQVVLVSGDQDFVHVLQELKRRGQRTVLVCLPLVTSSILKEIADKVINIEGWLSRSAKPSQVTEVPPSVRQVYFRKGAYYRNYKFVRDTLKSATFQVTLIDNYVDDEILETISALNPNVRVRIITVKIHNRGDFRVLFGKLKREGRDIDVYQESRQSRTFHDRFIRVDYNWWHLGASVKDLGRAVAMCSQISDPTIIQSLSQDESKVYGTVDPMH